MFYRKVIVFIVLGIFSCVSIFGQNIAEVKEFERARRIIPVSISLNIFGFGIGSFIQGDYKNAFFKVDEKRITNWRKLSGGNHIRSFCADGEKYVIRKFRQPHPRTAAAERAAYTALSPLGVAEEVLYLDDAGIKIARFIEEEHLGFCDRDQEDSINLLRKVHENAPAIPYSYDIFAGIDYWASLCRDPNSDHLKTLRGNKAEIDKIKAGLDSMDIKKVLCHGDPCAISNMLRLKDGSIRIIDWEYAGMADPFMDLALACVRQGVENINPLRSLERYLRRKPGGEETFRLKAYNALGAFELAAWKSAIQGEGF